MDVEVEKTKLDNSSANTRWTGTISSIQQDVSLVRFQHKEYFEQFEKRINLFEQQSDSRYSCIESRVSKLENDSNQPPPSSHDKLQTQKEAISPHGHENFEEIKSLRQDMGKLLDSIGKTEERLSTLEHSDQQILDRFRKLEDRTQDSPSSQSINNKPSLE